MVRVCCMIKFEVFVSHTALHVGRILHHATAQCIPLHVRLQIYCGWFRVCDVLSIFNRFWNTYTNCLHTHDWLQHVYEHLETHHVNC